MTLPGSVLLSGGVTVSGGLLAAAVGVDVMPGGIALSGSLCEAAVGVGALSVDSGMGCRLGTAPVCVLVGEGTEGACNAAAGGAARG